jgi:hypothetical protein
MAHEDKSTNTFIITIIADSSYDGLVDPLDLMNLLLRTHKTLIHFSGCHCSGSVCLIVNARPYHRTLAVTLYCSRL